MRRLWVRLSFIYVLTTVAVLLLLTVFFFQNARQPNFSAVELPNNISETDRALLQELANSGALPTMLRSLFSIQFIGLLLVTSIAGMLASVYASWRLTRPLTMLEEATRKVGQRELGYRVSATGSEEMQGLAVAFNGMVEALESAETRRQNLLADVSHELRTPLTVLQGNLRAALDGVEPLEPPQVAKLYDQTRQLNHLVQDLHDLAQAEANRLKLNQTTLDLADLVQQVGDIFAPLAAGEGIALSVEVGAAASIAGDRARLMQVLQNLIANALRYAKSGIHLAVQNAGDFVTVTVADDGAGIAPEHLPQIFDRFYRADDSRSRETGGTGLGLAIVKSIVEAHGGSVRALSRVGHGTTFTLRLPCGDVKN